MFDRFVKLVLKGLKGNIQEVTGLLQTATGVQGGAEIVIHTMKTKATIIKAVILLDGTNALNSLNLMVALHNTQVSCS